MPDTISLIMNSGIQFHEFKINLTDESEALQVQTRFVEKKVNDKDYDFDFAFNFQGTWVVKTDDVRNAIDPVTKKIDYKKVNPNVLIKIDTERGDFLYNIPARQSIEMFEGTWLPLPYFRKTGIRNDEVEEGPATWSRMYFSKIPSSDPDSKFYTHSVVLAFDTHSADGQNAYLVPENKDANSVFILSEDEISNYNLCASDWIKEWVKREYDTYIQNQLELQTGNISQQQRTSKFYYLGMYLNLMAVFQKTNTFPQIVLRLNRGTEFQHIPEIEVDLVLDIGNSRTCGLLFETTPIGAAFKFNDAAVPLEIRDLSYPNKVYRDPFSMRLAFTKPHFGKDVYIAENPKAFQWPSLVRIGEEATRLIVVNDNNTSNFTMSSPKRYLWDGRESDFKWEFIKQIKTNQRVITEEPAFVDGLNTQFTGDGKFIKKHKGIPGDPYFSRRSLMTFVLIEIILQALSQLNSFKHRQKFGQPNIPRKLKRITLTCPTAMVQKEQFYLRDLAADAIEALKEFFDDGLIASGTSGQQLPELRIIPSSADIQKPFSEIETKADWAYDEATCSQVAFIYGEMMHRYKDCSDLFFSTLGKPGKDFATGVFKHNLNFQAPAPRNTLTLATVDIGGGTTDLMICSYQTVPGIANTVLVPKPLFWEGYNLAGDDMLKGLIERIVMPQIASELKDKGCHPLVESMLLMFGEDNIAHSAMHKTMRRQFCTQIAVPIAYGIIQHAMDNLEEETRELESFFIQFPRPNQRLMNYVNDFFKERGAKNFDLYKVKWNLIPDSINRIVSDIVEKILHELCTIISQYPCDFLLLSGRPTNLPIIKELFLKFLPIMPDRIIQLGKYRLGNWYPFADPTGKIKDPKTCVAVGATIAVMASRLGRIDGFTLDTTLLRNEFRSTADYIGIYNRQFSKIPTAELTPLKNQFTIPFYNNVLLGFRQMNNSEWTGSAMYKLAYATKEAAERLATCLPLKVEISRDITENKEHLRIESVESNNPNANVTIKNGDLTLSLQTLPDEYGYWMDTGIFNLPLQYV